MTFHFKPVEEDTDPLNATVRLGGVIGTGKSFSALMLAKGLSGGKLIIRPDPVSPPSSDPLPGSTPRLQEGSVSLSKKVTAGRSHSPRP